MRLSRRSAIFGLFVFAYFLSNFFRSANAVISGDLTRELALGPAQLGLMTSLFYAAFALAQLPLGSGLDRFGPRLVTPALMLATVVGCLVFATAQSFGTLTAGRVLLGTGMAGVLMGAFRALGKWYPADRVATVSGLLVGLGASGGLAAATPLAWLNELVGWRAIFFGSAFVTLFSAASIALWTRNTPPGMPWPRAEPGADGGFRQIFGDRRFWRIAPLNFFLLGTMQAVLTLWGGPYLFHVMGMTPVEGGNLLLAMGLGLIGGYIACGWLADHFGAARSSFIAGVVFLLAQIVFVLPMAMPLGLLYPLYFVFGFCGSFNIVLLAQIRTLYPDHLGGRALTAGNTFGFAGTALIQWWMGLIISAFAADAQGRYPAAAYAAAFGFTAVCTALCLAWYAPLLKRQASGVKSQESGVRSQESV